VKSSGLMIPRFSGHTRPANFDDLELKDGNTYGAELLVLPRIVDRLLKRVRSEE
jgi:hypothetical protein